MRIAVVLIAALAVAAEKEIQLDETTTLKIEIADLKAKIIEQRQTITNLQKRLAEVTDLGVRMEAQSELAGVMSDKLKAVEEFMDKNKIDKKRYRLDEQKKVIVAK